MSIREEYYGRFQNPPKDKAKKILFAIFEDILDRRGFSGAWDETDEETQNEILATNLATIQKNL